MTVKLLMRIIGYGLVFVLSIGIAGGLGFMISMRFAMQAAPNELIAAVFPRHVPSYDASKPTVAILLGITLSEPTDVLGRYAIFAETGAYNVYTVASTPE